MMTKYSRTILLSVVLLFLSTFAFAGADLKCYPNPVAAGYENVSVSFTLPGNAPVTIMVYTLDGDLVNTLLNEQQFSAGEHSTVRWNTKNDNGKIVKPGPYVIMFEAIVEGVDEKITDKFVLIVGR